MDGLPDDLNGLIANQRLFRIKHVVCGQEGCDIVLFGVCVETDFSFGFLPAQQHQRIVDRDSCQPGRKFRSLIKGPQSLERAHDGVLHHVIDVGGIARYRPDGTSRGSGTLLNQLLESSVIASFTSLDQRLFGSRGIHRRAVESNEAA